MDPQETLKRIVDAYAERYAHSRYEFPGEDADNKDEFDSAVADLSTWLSHRAYPAPIGLREYMRENKPK